MQFKEFKKTLAERGIKIHFFLGRIELEGKYAYHKLELEIPEEIYEYAEEYGEVKDTLDEAALKYYRKMIAENPEFEAFLIREWSKEDTRAGRAVKYAIEERMAIMDADKEPEAPLTDERTAIMSCITH